MLHGRDPAIVAKGWGVYSNTRSRSHPGGSTALEGDCPGGTGFFPNSWPLGHPREKNERKPAMGVPGSKLNKSGLTHLTIGSKHFNLLP